MSIWIEDYIPFDYMRYGTEILPALEQATRGDTTVLNALLASATHFSIKLRSKYALPLPEEQRKALWRFHGLFDAATVRRIKAGEVWNPWEALAAAIPRLEGKSLKSLGTYGEMLKYHFLATFCCEAPPWSKNWPKPRRRFPSDEPYIGPILPHDETVFLWHEYRKRNAETRALWEAFYRPAPSIVEDMLHIDDEQRSSQLYKDLPRYIPTETHTESEMDISGFMTVEEIHYLFEHVRTHERPELGSIIDGCVRDGEGMDWDIDVEALSKDAIKNQEEIGGEVSWHYVRRKGVHINQRAIFEQWMKAHPVEMNKFVENYYRWIHIVEDEILHRMRFAVEHGWGILVMRAK